MPPLGRRAGRRTGSDPGLVPVDRAGPGRPSTPSRRPPRPAGVGAVAVQSANHEVGTLQPVAEIGARLDGVPLFVDACASAGRLPLPTGWSAAAASAHKWGGPAGVGVLLVRKGVRWASPFPADDRVDERASGFENVPAALAAAAALRAVVAERDEPGRPARGARGPDPRRRGRGPRRRGGRRPRRPAPPPGDVLVPLRRRGGAGDRARPARVRRGERVGVHGLDAGAEPRALAAMGVLTHGNVRVSLARETSEADVARFLAELPDVVRGPPRRGRPVSVTADVELDCRGLLCPMPVIELGRHLDRRAARRHDRRGRDRRRRPASTYPPGAGCAGRSTSARTPPTTAPRATWSAGSAEPAGQRVAGQVRGDVGGRLRAVRLLEPRDELPAVKEYSWVPTVSTT